MNNFILIDKYMRMFIDAAIEEILFFRQINFNKS